MHDAERAFLEQVAALLGQSGKRFDRISQNGSDPYQILGVARTASTGEIKAVYRRLIREYHPDLMVGQGISGERIDVANRKMADINAAFDHIMRPKGHKE